MCGGVARNWKVLNLSTLEILARVRAEGVSTLEILARVKAEWGGLGGSQESDGIEPQHPGNSGEGGGCGGG